MNRNNYQVGDGNFVEDSKKEAIYPWFGQCQLLACSNIKVDGSVVPETGEGAIAFVCRDCHATLTRRLCPLGDRLLGDSKLKQRQFLPETLRKPRRSEAT